LEGPAILYRLLVLGAVSSTAAVVAERYRKTKLAMMLLVSV
jgi:hypothetical protein